MNRTTSAALALGTLALGALALASPASASSSPAALSNVTPVISCVAALEPGTTRVFFGYYNSTGVVQEYAVGESNKVIRDGAVLTDAGQSTSFTTGDRPAAFFVDVADGTVDAPGSASWEIDYLQANYNHNLAAQGRYSACGPEVELSATGSGLLPVAGAALTGMALLGAVVVHRRRPSA